MEGCENHNKPVYLINLWIICNIHSYINIVQLKHNLLVVTKSYYWGCTNKTFNLLESLLLIDHSFKMFSHTKIGFTENCQVPNNLINNIYPHIQCYIFFILCNTLTNKKCLTFFKKIEITLLTLKHHHNAFKICVLLTLFYILSNILFSDHYIWF